MCDRMGNARKLCCSLRSSLSQSVQMVVRRLGSLRARGSMSGERSISVRLRDSVLIKARLSGGLHSIQAKKCACEVKVADRWYRFLCASLLIC